MEQQNNKKELIAYLIILLVLVMLSVCNNIFWKFGKQENSDNIQNNITYFKSNNVIYNVPYEEQWLD